MPLPRNLAKPAASAIVVNDSDIENLKFVKPEIWEAAISQKKIIQVSRFIETYPIKDTLQALGGHFDGASWWLQVSKWDALLDELANHQSEAYREFATRNRNKWA